MSIFGAIGSIVGGLLGNSQANKEMQFQKDLARKGVQWRAADARKAGIHPLAALGTSMPSYSPVGDGGLGQAMSNAGAALDAAKGGALQKRMVESEIRVNDAQVEALKAQAVSGIAEAQAVVKGGAQRVSYGVDIPNIEFVNEGVNSGSAGQASRTLLDMRNVPTGQIEDSGLVTANEKSGEYERDLWWHTKNGSLPEFVYELGERNKWFGLWDRNGVMERLLVRTVNAIKNTSGAARKRLQENADFIIRELDKRRN